MYPIENEAVNRNIGEDSLKALDNSKINGYIYYTIKDFLGRSILEIGSGIGNISSYVIGDMKKRDLVVLSDISNKYLSILKRKFRYNNVKVIKYNLSKTKTKRLRKYKIDTIICINVLEHIKNDDTALKDMYGILDKGGSLILLVPNLPSLYGDFDKQLGHFRRYNKKPLLKKLKKNKFIIKKVFYINFFGIIGWFVNYRLFGQVSISSKEVSFYDKLLPIFAIIDKITRYFTGLSMVCICKKS